jgi:two-component system sensor histidine kinase AlgZ
MANFDHGPDRRPWLPDFCRLPRIAAALAVAEMVVLVIALTPHVNGRWSLSEFAAASVFALWLALIVAVVLCKSRPLIDRLPPWLGVGAAMTLPMAAAAFGAWCVQEIDIGLGYHLTMAAGESMRFVSSVALLTGLITGVALQYFTLRDRWQAQVQAHAKAQVEALQARIRPHFLFNSMNTIASLVRSDPVTAERAVVDLADLFRAALGAGQGESTLAEEIELGERYLSIEKLRLGERLRVDWQLLEPLPRAMKLPRLILQPLLENAVLHGISRLPEGGEIVVRIAAEKQRAAFPDPQPGIATARKRFRVRFRPRLWPGFHGPAVGVSIRLGRQHDRRLRRWLLCLPVHPAYARRLERHG